MKKGNKKYIIIGVCLLAIAILVMLTVIGITGDTADDLDLRINQVLNESGVPDALVVLVDENGIRYSKYGENKENMNEETLFELGSMSKAFTALAILKLEEDGLIDLSASVDTYIPWLNFQYDGTHDGEQYAGEVKVQISHFLYQTSGIPYETIGDIPIGDDEDTLESTIKNLDNISLDFYPGTQYQYATINYDVLALVIESVTGEEFEDYVQKNIIEGLGLTNTYMGRENLPADKSITQGYKTIFFEAREYNAPTYKGNNAAGYVISCPKDMVAWIRCQLGQEDIDEQLKRLIEKSHIGDNTVASNGDTRYAAGWQVHIRGENYLHGGANPNYSSMLVINPIDELGVCVLTDMNSNAAEYIAGLVIAEYEGKEYGDYETDMYVQLDMLFSLIAIAGVILSALYFALIIRVLVEIARKKRRLERLENTKVISLLGSLVIIVFWLFTLYYLPNIVMKRLPWSAVNVWASPMVEIGCMSIGLGGTLLIVYSFLSFTFTKGNEKNYFALIPLSIINGIGSAFIIFIINESFNRNLEYSKELLICFLFALFLFIFTMKIVQGKLIVIAHNLVYEKRKMIINKIVKSSYERIEGIGKERIYVCLNNDISAIANIPGVIVRFASDILTLIFCFAYLCSKNVYSFTASVGVIIINTVISIVINKISAKYWEKTRDIQEVFMNQITDLVYGFKEIVLNHRRRRDISDDIHKSLNTSATLGKAAEVKVLGFNMYNSFVYNLVFGIVVFVFPLIMDFDVNQLRENLLIIFYMIGPFGGITYEISEIMQFRVNLKRVNSMIEELDMDIEDIDMNPMSVSDIEGIQSIELKNVQYTYENKENDEYNFSLGPVNMKLHAGETNFIIGGNGSGKSTLAKLLTGLYVPESGEILINNIKVNRENLNEYFSAIFSDYHLFKKLYGIDYENHKDFMREMLAKMKIERKIEIDEHGCIDNISLSTGQKKRLAYSIMLLENKPIVLFDEWAAEQDPEFREYFYNSLLVDLKQQGKCVIVITHDDRYFGCADKVFKLDEGKMVPYN